MKMYKVAEEQINRGLSPLARWILGSISGLFGTVMLLMANHGFAHDVENWMAYLAFGMFCIVIALTCFTWGVVRQFLGSCIGVTLFVLACWYILDELSAGTLISSRRSEPSVFNAVFFMVAFGVPGLAYAIKTKFGFQKRSKDE